MLGQCLKCAGNLRFSAILIRHGPNPHLRIILIILIFQLYPSEPIRFVSPNYKNGKHFWHWPSCLCVAVEWPHPLIDGWRRILLFESSPGEASRGEASPRKGGGELLVCCRTNVNAKSEEQSKQLLNALQRFNAKVPGPFRKGFRHGPALEYPPECGRGSGGGWGRPHVLTPF